MQFLHMSIALDSTGALFSFTEASNWPAAVDC